MKKKELKLLLSNFLESEDSSKKHVLTKTEINQISDAEELISLWEKAPPNLEAPIEARLSEVLRIISSDNIPEWFEKMLKQPNIIPTFLEEDFREKSRELLQIISQ